MSNDAISILLAYGLEVSELIPDSIQRVNSSGNRKKSGWYAYYSDPECLIYGDWRFGDSNIWKPEKELTREEAVIVSRKIREVKVKATEQRLELNEKAELQAKDLWASGEQSDDHPYLENKRIMGEGSRVANGELLIPVYSPDRKMTSIQRIFENGKKIFLTGGRIKGCFTPIKGSTKTIFICEGFATGSTINQLTGNMVFCALNASNLKEVAEWASNTYPCNELVICGDDDHETAERIGENPGKLKAEAAAVSSGATVLFPKFKKKAGKSDFNDMLEESGGLERLERIIFDRPAPSTLIFDSIGDIMSDPLKPKDWLIKDLILTNTTISMYGPSGSLKSFYAIDLALTIACGRLNHDVDGYLGKPVKQGKVMYLCGEGAEGIRGRLEAWQDEHKMTVPPENFFSSRGATMVDRPHERKRLIAMVRRWKPELLIIDTMRRNFSGHENDSKEVADFVAAIDEIRNSCRCSVMVVAHTSKDTSRGEMGSIVLRNAMDTRLRLKRNDEEKSEGEKDEQPLVSVIIAKQKDGKEGRFIDFGGKLWISDKLEDYSSLTVNYFGEPAI